MTDILELAKRVEAMDGPDREVDCQIALATLGGEIIWKTQNYTMDQYPTRRFASKNYLGGFGQDPVEPYTASLDASMTLVPEGHSWMLSVGGAAIAQVTDCTGDACTAPPDYEGKASTPALALVAAALRAKEATNEQ